MDWRRARGPIALAVLHAALSWSAPTFAAGALQEGRLQIRGVHRLSGNQSIALRFVVTPPPERRTTIPATLVIGDARIPLDAALRRNGRLIAHARRLALTGALPDFGVARVELLAPVDGVAEFRAEDCRAAAGGRTLDCRAPGGVPGDPPDAVYDADVDLVVSGTHQPLPQALASLTSGAIGDRGLTMLFNKYDGLQLGVGADGGPTWTLDGYSVTGGDIVADASGTATPTHSASGWTITGVATSAPFGTPFSWPFVLHRPEGGTPAALGGTWTLHLDASSLMPVVGDASLVLTVPPDGHATTDPTVLVGAGGVPLYDLAAGTCLVAPGGTISCRLPAPAVHAIVLHGALDVANGTGGGSFYVGSPPAISTDGAWSAVKTSAP